MRISLLWVTAALTWMALEGIRAILLILSPVARALVYGG